MTKSDLVDRVAAKAGVSKAGAADLLDAVLSTISEALERGESVSNSGFGTFSVKERAEREGRNSRTGEAITIAASKVASFKAGRGLREALR